MADVEKQNLPDRPSIFNNITNVEDDFSQLKETEYSFDHRITRLSKGSVVLTVFNIFRSFVAIGVLTLPYAVSLTGPVIALIAQLIVGFIIYTSVRLLLEVADDISFKGANYETLGKLLWGKVGQRLVLISLYMCSIATFMGGILFTVDFLNFAFCSHDVAAFCGSKPSYLLVAFVVSVIISLVQSLRPFGYISIASTVIIIISLLSLSVYNFHFIATTKEIMKERWTFFNIKNFFSYLGIALYTTEGIALVLPIRASFKDNKSFPKVFTITFVFINFFYILIGVFSYLVS